MFLILHNIRSIHNVGSIFRTAECAGVKKLFLTGYTPAPTDRFGRKRKAFAKVSLRAEEKITWEYKKDIFSVIKGLKEKKVKIIAVEQTKNSINYKKLKLKSEDVVFIFGNEVNGIDEEVLKEADTTIEIPMRGDKESLNVSVAVGVILFEFA